MRTAGSQHLNLDTATLYQGKMSFASKSYIIKVKRSRQNTLNNAFYAGFRAAPGQQNGERYE